METVLLFTLGTARSNFPSPLRSPIAAGCGKVPTVKLDGPLKVPSPLPRRIETLLAMVFTTTKSGMPSPLRSAIFTETGPESGVDPVPTTTLGADVKVPSPLPKKTEIVSAKPSGAILSAFATARSSFPSPFKSPTATLNGSLPAARFARPPKLRFGPLMVPWEGPLATVNFSVSRSGSLPVSEMLTAVSSGVLTLWAVAVGGSLTGVTVIDTVAGAESEVPLFTLNVNLLKPLKLAFGV